MLSYFTHTRYQIPDIVFLLQSTQPTSGGAVPAVMTECWCKLCRKSPPPTMGAQFTVFGKPVIQTRWMAGTAPHKSRSNNHTQTSMDLRYLPQTNIR